MEIPGVGQLTMVALLLAPSAARAELGSLSLDARAGVASPNLGGVSPGPAYGAEARLGISDQLGLAAGASQSLHPVAASLGGGLYSLTQAGGGATLSLDRTPIVAELEVGVSAVWKHYLGQTALAPWPYVGLGIRSQLWGPLEVGGGLRYALGNGGDFVQLMLSVGLIRPGRRSAAPGP